MSTTRKKTTGVFPRHPVMMTTTNRATWSSTSIPAALDSMLEMTALAMEVSVLQMDLGIPADLPIAVASEPVTGAIMTTGTTTIRLLGSPRTSQISYIFKTKTFKKWFELVVFNKKVWEREISNLRYHRSVLIKLRKNRFRNRYSNIPLKSSLSNEKLNLRQFRFPILVHKQYFKLYVFLIIFSCFSCFLHLTMGNLSPKIFLFHSNLCHSNPWTVVDRFLTVLPIFSFLQSVCNYIVWPPSQSVILLWMSLLLSLLCYVT